MPALSIENVSFCYRKKEALREVSFSVDSGSFCALLGPNGAGKSTLFSLLTHLRRPKVGSISINDQPMAKHPYEALAQIGIVFQQPTLDLDATVHENLKYFAGLHGIRGTRSKERIEKALSRMDMMERSKEKVRALNGGHRRRMEIARALIHDPKILLLDEPTVGLDPHARDALTGYVHSLAEEGYAVLWATHLVDEVQDNDQVVVLYHGRVLTKGRAADIAQDQTLKEQFLHLTADGAFPK